VFGSAPMALISCSHCGAQIADVAPTCPRCGGPNLVVATPVQTVIVRRTTSPLTWILGTVFCVFPTAVAVLAGFYFSVNPPPPTPSRAPSAQWQKLQAEPAATAKGREALIQKLLNADVFNQVDYRTLGATIQVGPAFYLASFDDKQKFVNVVATAAWKRSESATLVTLVDYRTNKTVGTYSLSTGLSLE
jgi:hypothetical protein